MLIMSLVLVLASSLVVVIVANNNATSADSEEPALRDLRNACEAKWEHSQQRRLKDPSSLQWDSAVPERGIYQGKAAIFLRYRAINSYGGFTLQQAICEIDRDSGKVLGILE